MQEQKNSVTDTFIQAIHETIFKVYGKCYIGFLRVHKLNDGSIDLSLGLNNSEKPIHICALLDQDSFLKFLEQELHTRGLTHTRFYSGYKTDAFERHYQDPINHGRHHVNDSDLVSNE